MEKHRVLVVEDDLQAQENIAHLVEQESDLELIGISPTIESADWMSTQFKPDLVICDVMLPPATSFDWLSQLDHIPFELIFTTSFEEFAIKAFRLAAVDYLIKPIDPLEFGNSIKRYRTKKGTDANQIRNLLTNLMMPKAKSKIALPTFTGYLFVEVKDIIRCESDNTYTTFFLKDKQKILVSRTLKDVEQMLECFDFFRIHNSHLINLSYVVEYFKGEGGQVKLADGSIVDVSRRKKDSFLKDWKS